MTQLGWKAGAEQYPPDELLDYAIEAEQAGFDSIDLSDHFAPWSEAGQSCFAWTWLGAVAARTNRIHLGTGVTCPTLRYHPAVVAQAVATVEYLAPGRVHLGVGTGEALRSIPLYISAMVPKSARFAGKYGDGLFTVGGQPAEVYQRMIKSFEDGAWEAGKNPSYMPKLIELNVAYTDDEDAAIDCMKKYWAGSFIPALYDQKIYTPRDSARNGEVVGSDVIKSKMCLSGNPDDHVRYAQEHIDLGFTHLFYHCAGPDQRAFLEGYGRDVLPRLRQPSFRESSTSREPVSVVLT